MGRLLDTKKGQEARPAQVPTDSRAQQPVESKPGSTGVPSGVGPVNSSVRLLRFPAVRERVGLSRSTVWRLERRGEFPKHRRISANAVAWVDEEVMTWIRSRR